MCLISKTIYTNIVFILLRSALTEKNKKIEQIVTKLETNCYPRLQPPGLPRFFTHEYMRFDSVYTCNAQ